MKGKIEWREFVELDKLLPKDKLFDGRQNFNNETKLAWVQSEGNTYLVLARKSTRINCFRRWEQAFRTYATIYCMVHPQRAREIWQYISVINTASMAYSWENVYNYDITFRQLMEFNPSRSWAVTYNQMWNLAMTNPINNSGNNSQSRRASFGNGTSSNFSQSGSAFKKKVDYCWGFNKGVKCKFKNKCKFIEHCSYCDSPAHGVVNCEKLGKNKDNFSGGKQRKKSK